MAINWEEHRYGEDAILDLIEVFEKVAPINLINKESAIGYIEDICGLTDIKCKQIASTIIINAIRIGKKKEI